MHGSGAHASMGVCVVGACVVVGGMHAMHIPPQNITRCGLSMCRWYASYWNVFLFPFPFTALSQTEANMLLNFCCLISVMRHSISVLKLQKAAKSKLQLPQMICLICSRRH